MVLLHDRAGNECGHIFLDEEFNAAVGAFVRAFALCDAIVYGREGGVERHLHVEHPQLFQLPGLGCGEREQVAVDEHH